jgi:hypothetical protein
VAFSSTTYCQKIVMAQPAHIELQTGPDQFYLLAVHILWLLAAATAIAHIGSVAWPLMVAACALLFLLRPGGNAPIRQSCRLYLYRDGTAGLGRHGGTWGAQSWTCRWFSVLRIDLPHRRIRILVCAGRNSVHEYRRLLIWTRFVPFDTSRDWRCTVPP